MKKGEYLISRDGKRIYQFAGRWDGEVVLVPVDDKDDQVLIYTPSELETLIGEGQFRKLYKVEQKNDFFSKKYCDRCKKELTGGRIMSKLSEECICIDCSEAEKLDKDYKKAVEAEVAEIRKGNYNYKGLKGGQA